MISAKTVAVAAMLALAGGSAAQKKTDEEQRIGELIEQLKDPQAHQDAARELVRLEAESVEPRLLGVINHRAAAQDWNEVVLLSRTLLQVGLRDAHSPPFLNAPPILNKGRLIATLERHGFDFDQKYMISTHGQVFPVAPVEEGVFYFAAPGVLVRRFRLDKERVVFDLAFLVWQSKDPTAAKEAAMVLGALGSTAAGAIRTLIHASATSKAFNAQEAISALGMIGPVAKDAIPTLEKLTEHEDPQIAERAKAALRQVRER